MNLRKLGWTANREAEWNKASPWGRPARVSAQWRNAYDVWTEHGECRATATGALRHSGESLPVVGDWVDLEGGAASDGRIHGTLRRKSLLRRRAVGRRTEAQLIAANLDTVFIVTAHDGDLSLRRLDRYVTAVWDSGATPVVVVNKTDLASDEERVRAEIEERCPGVSVHGVSAVHGGGLDALSRYLATGQTVAMVGSSGVGKTTLLSRLAVLELRTLALGVDGRGQHTTTTRQMYRLPSDAWLIDTPGMRELGLWAADEALDASFSEVESLVERCRFSDCQHVSEPGCAVLAALEEGELSDDRFESYHKLQRELEHDAARFADGLTRSRNRKKKRAFARMCRARTKAKGR